MTAASRSFAIERGRIRLADAVLVYLERTLAPPGALPPGVTPRAYGVAPMAVSPAGSILAAVAPGEAVWLGFQAAHEACPAIVRVRVNRLKPLDAVTGGLWTEGLSERPRNYLICPPDYCLPGLRQPAGHLPFGLGDGSPRPDVLEDLTVFTCGAMPGVVAVRFVRPAIFTRLTGMVPTPLQEDGAYKGWRLP